MFIALVAADAAKAGQNLKMIVERRNANLINSKPILNLGQVFECSASATGLNRGPCMNSGPCQPGIKPSGDRVEIISKPTALCCLFARFEPVWRTKT